MAREYDDDVNELLGMQRDPAPSPPMNRAQFRKAQFVTDDLLPENARPYKKSTLGDEEFERRRDVDMTMGENRTRIGERTYPSIAKAYEHGPKGERVGVSHVSIPTESGWHADITKHFVQPVYYGEYPEDESYTTLENKVTNFVGAKAWRTGSDRVHAPGMDIKDVDRIIDNPDSPEVSPGAALPHMRIGMGEPWARLPDSAGTSYPDIHRSAMFLSEQGIHKAIDTISNMPRPKDMGPPRRLKPRNENLGEQFG